MIDWLTSTARSPRRCRHHPALDSIVLRQTPGIRAAFVALHRSQQQSSEPPMLPALCALRATRNRAVYVDLQPETGLNRTEIPYVSAHRAWVEAIA
jgi:hypothetical protein